MELAGVGARLASGAVMPLVTRLFVRKGPGAGLTGPGKPVRISSLVSFRGERRTLTEKELRPLVRESVARAVPEGAGAGVEPDAVGDALVRTLHALGDIGMDDVQAVEPGKAALRRELFAAAGGQRLTAQLGEASEQVYVRVLDTACVHILHFFTQRSTFVARTLVEQSRRLAELIARGDLLLERLTSRTSEDAAFERRYAEYVRKKQSRITVYGVDLRHEHEWPHGVPRPSSASTPVPPPPLRPAPLR